MSRAPLRSLRPTLFEQLEPRLLLSGDSIDVPWPEYTGEIHLGVQDRIAGQPFGPRDEFGQYTGWVPSYRSLADYDYDWWYGCAPTVEGMRLAYYDMMLGGDDTCFPGNRENWRFGEYPSNDSEIFAVPDYANGVISGWGHTYDSTYVTADDPWDWYDKYYPGHWRGHAPDSISDFMLTVSGDTSLDFMDYSNSVIWGMTNYMAWDDPRTPENESWQIDMGTIVGFEEYKSEIDRGNPVHLILLDANPKPPDPNPPMGWHSVLGVGYYDDPEVEPFFDCYTTWNSGLEEWYWNQDRYAQNSAITGWEFQVQGGIKMSDPHRDLTGLTGYFALSHTDVRQLFSPEGENDYTIEIGLTDYPDAPVWEWDPSSEGWDTYKRFLVMTDIDLGDQLDYLKGIPDASENWYIKVFDGEKNEVGEIMDFQIRYTNPDTDEMMRWFTPDAGAAINDNSAAYAYVTSHVVGEIEGTKWHDRDGDGVQDAGEEPLVGWTIFLDDDFDGVLDAGEDSCVTGADGSYLFTGLERRTYTIGEVLPAGWAQSLPGGEYTSLLSGQWATGVDFGNYQPGQISGMKFNDINADGIKDAGETGLANWTIFLDADDDGLLDWTDINDNDVWDDGEGERWTLTAGDGSYSFDALAPGDYVVSEILPSDWQQTTPAGGTYELTIASGDDITDQDFGNARQPLPDLIDGGSANSDFSPAVVSPGETLTVQWRVTNSGTANAASPFEVQFYASVDNDPTTADDNYLLHTEVVPGLAMGASADLDLAITLPATLPAGEYYVAAVIDPTDAILELDETNNAASDDAYPLTVPGIRGFKWADINEDGVWDVGEPPVTGWVVFLDADGDGIRTWTDANGNEAWDAGEGERWTTTDADGLYSFTNLVSGVYTVAEVVQAGWTPSFPDNPFHTVPCPSGELTDYFNFGNKPEVDLISDGDAYSRFDPGTVYPPGESWDVWWDIRNVGSASAGTFHVDFYASADSTITTDDYHLGTTVVNGLNAGAYKDINLSLLGFPEIPAGNYYVGIIIDQDNEIAEYDETNNTDVDLDQYPLVVINRPDLQDFAYDSGAWDFEPTVVNPGDQWDATWTIHNTGLADADPFKVKFYASTNANITSFDYHLATVDVQGLPAKSWTDVRLAMFSFPEIPAGNYYVGAILDAGDLIIEYNEDNNVGISATYPLLVPGINGSIWHDIDSEADKDDDEAGRPGWLVYLDTNDNGQPDPDEAVTLTDTNGDYSFTGLAPGTYNIRQVPTVFDSWQLTSPSGGAVVASFAGSEVVEDNDFFVAMPSRIDGWLWEDLNGNRYREIIEPALYNWTVYLDDNNNSTLEWTDANGNDEWDAGEGERWTLTDIYGFYIFKDVMPKSGANKSYYIREVLPRDEVRWLRTEPLIDYHEVSVTSAHLFPIKNFGNALPATIEGLDWHDLNANSIKAPNEPGLEGWIIYIDENSNHQLDHWETSTTTDADGRYVITGLLPGSYNVRQVLPDDWQQSYPGGSGDNTVQLVSDGTEPNVNFGNYQYATISGIKFHDIDADGVYKPSEEPGLEDWRIFLDTDGNGQLDWTDDNANGVWDTGEGERWTLTDEDGSYLFESLVPGSYTITEQLVTGWQQSAPGVSTYFEIVPSARNVTDRNFGNYVPAQIIGTKYEDLNGDGSRQGGEPGLEGWTIFLDQNDNGVIDSGESWMLTGATGQYHFYGLIPGPYIVAEVLQTDWVQSAPAGETHELALLSEDVAQNIDFGNYEYGEIHGHKWEDSDIDGIWDAGEPPLAGWRIFLDENDDDILDWTDTNSNGLWDAGEGERSALTDAEGAYSFTQLDLGDYTVAEVLQAGWFQSAPTEEGTFDETITSGKIIEDLDFGNYRTGQISGVKYNDLSADGTKDAGELGLAGWTIFIDENSDGLLDWTDTNGNSQWDEGEGERFVVTDEDGTYTLDDLEPGSYVLAEVAEDGYLQTAPTSGTHTVVVTSGLAVPDVDFGNVQAGTISGHKFNDIDANGVWDWDDANGNDVWDDGEGEPPLSGWTITIFLDRNDNGQLDPALDGAVVTTTTDSQGRYTLDALLPSAYPYVVGEGSQDGWAQTAPAGGTYRQMVTPALEVEDKDFGNVQTGQVSGVKFEDLDGDGVRDDGEPTLAGWTIFVDDNSDGLLTAGEQSAVTDEDGRYELTGLLPGDYTIAEVNQAGWTQSAPADDTYDVTIVSGSDLEDRDFGNWRPGTIEGVKWHDANYDGVKDAGESLLANWTIYLDANANGQLDGGEASTITAGDGSYSLTDLVPGDYVVAEVLQAGWGQTYPVAGTHEVTVSSNQTLSGINFGNVEAAEVHGAVWNDLDGDGVRDVGEDGLAGWTVFVDRNANGEADLGEPSATTDANGSYQLAGLQPGACTVMEIIPADYWTQTSPATGSYELTLGIGETVTGRDFGNQSRPVANDLNINAAEDATVNDSATGWDFEGDDLTFGVVDEPSHGTVTMQSDGDFTYVPDDNWNGPDSFTFRTFDGVSYSDAATVTITYSAINDAPTAQDDDVSVDEDDTITITLVGSDVETSAGDLVYTIDASPTHGTLTLDGNQALYTPDAEYNGPDSFTFTVTDTGDPAGSHANPGDLTSTPATVSITVDPVNDVPTADPQTVPVVYQGTTVDITLTGDDLETPDGDLVYHIATPPAHGTLTLAGNLAQYTPSADWFGGLDTFTFTVTDTGDPAGTGQGIQTSPPATVTIDVAPYAVFGPGAPTVWALSSKNKMDLTMKGPGQGVAYFSSDDPKILDQIIINGSTTATQIDISCSTEFWRINNVEVHGSLKSLTTDADLLGNVVIDGYAGCLEFGDAYPVVGGHLVQIGNAGNPVKISFGRATDVTVDSAAPIASLSATDWCDFDGVADEISTAELGQLRIGGSKKLNLPGNFEADLDVNILGSARIAGSVTAEAWSVTYAGKIDVGGDFAVDAFEAHTIGTFGVDGSVVDTTMRIGQTGGESMGKMDIGGWLDNSRVFGQGNFSRVTLGGMKHSAFCAGLEETMDAFTPGTTATIGRFKVDGGVSDGGNSVIDSLLAAAALERVWLTNVRADNAADAGYADLLGAGNFGLAADQVVESLDIRQADGTRFRWKQPNVPNGLAIGPDFYVQVV